MKKLNIIQKFYYRTKIFFSNLFRWGSCGSDISDTIQRLYKKGHYAELHEFDRICKNQNIDPVKFLKCDHINIVGNINGDKKYIDEYNKEI